MNRAERRAMAGLSNEFFARENARLTTIIGDELYRARRANAKKFNETKSRRDNLVRQVQVMYISYVTKSGKRVTYVKPEDRDTFVVYSAEIYRLNYDLRMMSLQA